MINARALFGSMPAFLGRVSRALVLPAESRARAGDARPSAAPPDSFLRPAPLGGGGGGGGSEIPPFGVRAQPAQGMAATA